VFWVTNKESLSIPSLKGNIMARLTVAQMEAALKAAGHEVSTERELGAALGLGVAKVEQWLSAKAEATKV
jgi:hypothetical protein